MKKFLSILIMLLLTQIPIIAVCYLGETCASSNSPIAEPALQDKYIQNNIQNIQPTTQFQHNNIKVYDGMDANIENPKTQLSPNKLQPQSIYDNCQFGNCLP